MDVSKIDKVARVAQSAEQKSAREFKAGQQSHQQKCEQLDQLQQFKREYESRLEAMGEAGMEARQLQDYRRFLGNLNQAIEQQNQEVASSEEAVNSAREDWLAKSRRSAALDQLVDQQRLKQRQALDQAEQRESDEKSMSLGNGAQDS